MDSIFHYIKNQKELMDLQTEYDFLKKIGARENRRCDLLHCILTQEKLIIFIVKHMSKFENKADLKKWITGEKFSIKNDFEYNLNQLIADDFDILSDLKIQKKEVSDELDIANQLKFILREIVEYHI